MREKIGWDTLDHGPNEDIIISRIRDLEQMTGAVWHVMTNRMGWSIILGTTRYREE